MPDVDVSWGGATLVERLAYARGRERQGATDPAPLADDQGLAVWARAASAGDPAAFARRLSWDGISPAVAGMAMAADAPAGFPIAPWLARLVEFETEARVCAALAGTTAWEAEVGALGPELPFVDAWVPVLRVARRRLLERVSVARTWLSDQATRALEDLLLRELSRLGELALLEDCRAQVGDAGDSAAAYWNGIRTLLATRYGAWLRSLPVLARHAVLVADQWVDQTAALVLRLETDRAAIAAAFGRDAAPPCRLVVGLSDRHDGGGRVARVEFASGLRLAYKPRNLALEKSYNDLLTWLRTNGLPAAPPALRVLDCGTHGWVEWTEQASAGAGEAVRDYYRAAGALVCVAHVLSATDLHSENLVASSDGPVLVDTEMLLQPSVRPVEARGEDHADSQPQGSALASGLVSFVVIDAGGKAFDVGGLRPAAARALSVPMRRWLNVRRHDIDYELQHDILPVLQNDVRLHGVVQRVDDFADALCEGFDAAYRFLETHQSALLARGGPLEAFADCQTRVLFRPSDRYAAAQYALATPRYQRRGVDRSLGLETFDRVFVREIDRPRLWPLVHDERRMLEALEIPRLTVSTSAVDLRALTGEVIAGYYAHSGLDVARARLAGLSAADRAYQLDQLRAACSPAVPTAVERPKGEARTDDDLVTAAERIGMALLRRAERAADGSLVWPSSRGRTDLYGGAGGVAVFLSALARATSREMWRAAAERSLRGLAAEIGRTDHAAAPRLGICSGRPSLAYAVALAGHLLGDDRLIDRAIDLLSAIPSQAIESDVVLDVEGGAAGTLLACLAVHALVPDDRCLGVARASVARVTALQIASGPDRGAWATGTDGRPRPGFAHGASGIAYALCRWAAVAGSPHVIEPITAAWAYERRFFLAHGHSWPAVGADGSRVPMTAWCHGAPGVALGRSSAPDGLNDPHLAVEIETAMSQTLSAPATQLDHLCCGNLGRAEVALTVGIRARRPEWVAAGVARARAVAGRILADGRLGLRGRGFQAGAAAPEFFQGTAGIGYQLLRAASPDVFPSVLACELPASRQIRTSGGGVQTSDTRD